MVSFSGTIEQSSAPPAQSINSFLANLPPNTKIRVFPSRVADDVCQIDASSTGGASSKNSKINKEETVPVVEEAGFFTSLSKDQNKPQTYNSSKKGIGGAKFAYDALKTKPAKDQFVVRPQPNGEIHIYPSRSVYAFNKRVRAERDLQDALDRIKVKEQQGDRDRLNWEKNRKSKPKQIDDDIDNLPGASKRPAMRTGCPELDMENMLLQKFEDPNERVKQKFIKEDPEFKKRRKLLLDQKLKYQRLENTMADTACAATILKPTDDDEFDWDGEEQDRFSDDEGNDGGEFAVEGAQAEAAPEGMEDGEMAEKEEKFGKDTDEAQFDQISRLLKEDNPDKKNVKSAKEDLLAKELAELSAVGDETLLPARKQASQNQASSGTNVDAMSGLLESPSVKIDKLFEGKPPGFQVSIKEIMKAVGAKDNSHPNWHEAIKHLKQHYATQKAITGVYLFSRKQA